jgi:hypothetical protein
MMTEEELERDVREYAAKLSAETGVELDPNEVWAEVQKRRAKEQ